VYPGGDGRLNRSDHGRRSGGDIEQDFRAEPLDHLDRDIKAHVPRITRAGDAQILGSYAQSCLHPGVGSEPWHEWRGHFDAEIFALGP